MKWAVFLLGLLAARPIGRGLRDRPTLRAWAWTAVGFLPFYDSLDFALVSFGGRAGDTHGLEVALLDWLALTLYFSQRGPARRLPYRFELGAYLLVALVSCTQAQWPLGAFGYCWRLCRGYLVFAAICRAGDDRRMPGALLRGLMLGLAYEGALAIWQRQALGLHRIYGTFGHGNTLGLVVNLVVMVPIALVFARRAGLLTTLAPVAALPALVLTVSRGTLLFLGVGGSLVFLGSIYRRFSMRKAKIGLVALALVIAILPFAITTLQSRSHAEQDESMRLRERYEAAAAMMLEDHPLGVGANHFTAGLLMGGYGDRAGVNWTQRAAIVHNIYWLTAAEMGYAGVAALLLLFLAPLRSAFRYSLRPSADPRGDALLGLGVGLTIFYAHSAFEWVWRDTAAAYVYWMAVGLVAVLSRQVQAGLPARAAAPGRAFPSPPRQPDPAVP